MTLHLLFKDSPSYSDIEGRRVLGELPHENLIPLLCDRTRYSPRSSLLTGSKTPGGAGVQNTQYTTVPVMGLWAFRGARGKRRALRLLGALEPGRPLGRPGRPGPPDARIRRFNAARHSLHFGPSDSAAGQRRACGATDVATRVCAPGRHVCASAVCASSQLRRPARLRACGCVRRSVGARPRRVWSEQ